MKTSFLNTRGWAWTLVLAALAACNSSEKGMVKGGISQSDWLIPTQDGSRVEMRVRADSITVTSTCHQTSGQNLVVQAQAQARVTEKSFQILQPAYETRTGEDGLECRAGIQATQSAMGYKIQNGQLVLQDAQSGQEFRYTPTISSSASTN